MNKEFEYAKPMYQRTESMFSSPSLSKIVIIIV